MVKLTFRLDGKCKRKIYCAKKKKKENGKEKKGESETWETKLLRNTEHDHRIRVVKFVMETALL